MAVLLAALAGWYLASSITKPVLSVREQIGKIARHKDFSPYVEVAGDREVRQLARAVNVLIDSSKDNVGLIIRAVAELAETSAQMGILPFNSIDRPVSSAVFVVMPVVQLRNCKTLLEL